MKHVQAELAPQEYEAFHQAARKEHLTLKEAARMATLGWAMQKGTYHDPLDDIVGIAEGGDPDASQNHDDLYLED